MWRRLRIKGGQKRAAGSLFRSTLYLFPLPSIYAIFLCRGNIACSRIVRRKQSQDRPESNSFSPGHIRRRTLAWGLHAPRSEFAKRGIGVAILHSPSNSPTGLRSSTRSHTALTIMMMGTPSNKPHTPHSQPQNNTPTKTTTALIRLARPVSHGVSK